MNAITRDPSIAELIGVTVPIHVGGLLAAPEHQVKWEQINSPTIKEAIENGLLDKLSARRSTTEQLLGDESVEAITTSNADIRDRSLGEAIRDLLGIVAR